MRNDGWLQRRDRAPKELTAMTASEPDHTIIGIAKVPRNRFTRVIPLGMADEALTTRPDRVVIAVASPPLKSALLMVDRGPNAGSSFLIDRPVTSMGRHHRSNIFLDDVTVSRRHAELHWINDEVRVNDLGSLNGTYVNGEAIESAVLTHGDELQCGKFRLTFWRARRPHRGIGE
jgi:pSer/pThr/pTyr-binding forkhead associated (FHA) protein